MAHHGGIYHAQQRIGGEEDEGRTREVKDGVVVGAWPGEGESRAVRVWVWVWVWVGEGEVGVGAGAGAGAGGRR